MASAQQAGQWTGYTCYTNIEEELVGWAGQGVTRFNTDSVPRVGARRMRTVSKVKPAWKDAVSTQAGMTSPAYAVPVICLMAEAAMKAHV